MFVWIGKDSTKDEKAHALKIGYDYLEKENLPKWTQVTRVAQGTETALFKQYFSIWTEPEDSPFVGLGRIYPESQIAEWDVKDLHIENRRRLARSGGAAIGFCPDDGSGKKEIWRIEDFQMVPSEEQTFGKLFGGDSYVILYTYDNGGRESYIIYFWQVILRVVNNKIQGI